MGPLKLSAPLPRYLRCCSAILSGGASLSVVLLAGCGATPGSISTKQPQGNPTNPTSSDGTSVTVLATSTANDELSAFNVQITGITLTNSAGKTVNLVSAPVSPEFIHLNGIEEPLVTVNVPPDTYTSATVSVSSAFFVCTNYQASSGLQNSTFEDSAVPAASVTTILPSAITVGGSSMGLTLDLLVSQSATFSSCQGDAATQFSITPTFALAATPVATGSSNLQASGLHGLISSMNGSVTGLTVAGADGPKQYGPTWQVLTDNNTAFQGVSGFAQLTAGMPVDMDVTVQQDGSLMASRIAVYDTNTTDLNVFTGPMNAVATPTQVSVVSQEQQGYLDTTSYYLGALPGNFDNAEYQISGALNNLQSLPFAARFASETMVAGQNVSMTSHASSFSSGSLPVATLTLMPQTIDGTVSAISSEGAFTTYTVTLAPYDLFPNLSYQPDQATLLTNPNTVVVYADSNTQSRNSAVLSVGGVFRFNGLVFNDGGTLRMDCAQINDGVPE